jgi:hypothetical protein
MPPRFSTKTCGRRWFRLCSSNSRVAFKLRFRAKDVLRPAPSKRAILGMQSSTLDGFKPGLRRIYAVVWRANLP